MIIMSDKKSSNIDVKNLQQLMMGGGRRNMQGGNQNKKQNNQNNRYTNKKENHGPKERKGNNNKGTGDYVGAPYNFVPFSNRVYEYPKEKKVKQNVVSDELLTGEILYEITAKTPIMVDDGTGKFHKNPEGKFSIQGSTMRGLIRNNVQILGFSSFYEDIDDYALMYRNVASGAKKEKKRYNTILGSKPLGISDGDKSYAVGILLNVKAGYLFNEHGKYVIYQNCINSIKKEYEGMNYYALSERKIVQDYLKSKKNGTRFCYDFFLQDGKSRMQHEFKAFKRDKKNGRVHYTGKENKLYEPYYEKVSYEIARQKDVTAVGKPGKYKQEGYVMCTGKMNEKKVIYIIPQIDKNKKSIEILEKDVKAFKIDIEKRKNTLKQFGGREFFDLPKEGEMKPVFYIDLNGRLYFGFTPRLRLFYDHKIRDGLNKNHKKEGIMDYSKAIFGYSNKKGSFRSKVSFSDAVVWNTDVKEEEEKQYILSEPKPTSYLDYLEQSEEDFPSTYNDKKLKLRGVKQYWLHSDTVPNKQTSKNEAVVSKFCPLPKETKFEGKVRFRNMTRDELGLLLWSMQLEENSQMNIGKAKAYGYGNIKLSVKEARCINKQKAYQTECLTLNPLEKIEIKPLIDEYKAEIQKFLGSKELMEWPNIRDFFNMKDVTKIPDEDTIKYMSITDKDYQNRKKALPKVGNVINNK